MGFSQDELDLIDRTQEVEIETSAPDGATHRTIIWVVVDGDSVFIRSYRGANARWYREALAHPAVALHVDGPATPGDRPSWRPTRDSIERTSAGLLRKYAATRRPPRWSVPRCSTSPFASNGREPNASPPFATH